MVKSPRESFLTAISSFDVYPMDNVNYGSKSYGSLDWQGTSNQGEGE